MYDVRESWTDERLDDFAKNVNRHFDDVDKRFDRVDADIRDLRGEMNTRFDALQRTLLQIGGGMIAALVAGFAALVATQL